jgi:hypothetical protein
MALEKKDVRRWVVLTLRSNGAAEAQFPLPVTPNGVRVLMEQDVPYILPAFYVNAIKACEIPRFTTRSTRKVEGRIVNTDEGIYDPVGYRVDVCEIPAEYQTLEGIQKFEELMADVKTAPAGFEDLVGTKIGVRSYPDLSVMYDAELKAKADAKNAEKKPEVKK